MKTTATPLHTRIDQMLTEARVILPGAQAILGFQLIVTIRRHSISYRTRYGRRTWLHSPVFY